MGTARHGRHCLHGSRRPAEAARPGIAQAHDREREGGDTARDYIVSLADRTVSVAFGEPEWASAYWAMKSDFTAPGNPALRIELAREDRRTRVTPFLGGTNAGNGAFTPDPKNSADA